VIHILKMVRLWQKIRCVHECWPACDVYWVFVMKLMLVCTKFDSFFLQEMCPKDIHMDQFSKTGLKMHMKQMM
jgi:hypothetical protein